MFYAIHNSTHFGKDTTTALILVIPAISLRRSDPAQNLTTLLLLFLCLLAAGSDESLVGEREALRWSFERLLPELLAPALPFQLLSLPEEFPKKIHHFQSPIAVVLTLQRSWIISFTCDSTCGIQRGRSFESSWSQVPKRECQNKSAKMIFVQLRRNITKRGKPEHQNDDSTKKIYVIALFFRVLLSEKFKTCFTLSTFYILTAVYNLLAGCFPQITCRQH